MASQPIRARMTPSARRPTDHSLTAEHRALLKEQAELLREHARLVLDRYDVAGHLVHRHRVTNVMLVSVTERTREIGLRRAVGARSLTIAGQFLVEALALTGMGSLTAILLSWIVALAVRSMTGWPVVMSPGAVAVALAVSGMAGLGSGLFPACQAARVNPIDALRFE